MTQPGPAASPARADPERGLRGVASALLVFEAVAIGLGMTVVNKGDHHAGAVALSLVGALALAHLAAPAVIARRAAVAVIAVLQVLVIATWAIHPALGVTGIVFAVVWVIVFFMRREFRRRLAAAAAGSGGPGEQR